MGAPANRYFAAGTASGVVKNAPGVLFSIVAHNANAAARFLQVHNVAAALSGSEVPVFTINVPATSSIQVGQDVLTDSGMNLSTGITLGMSTARESYTAATAGETTLFALYA